MSKKTAETGHRFGRSFPSDCRKAQRLTTTPANSESRFVHWCARVWVAEGGLYANGGILSKSSWPARYGVPSFMPCAARSHGYKMLPVSFCSLCKRSLLPFIRSAETYRSGSDRESWVKYAQAGLQPVLPCEDLVNGLEVLVIDACASCFRG